MLGSPEDFIFTSISEALSAEVRRVACDNPFGNEAAYHIQHYIKANMKTFFATCPESEKLKAAKSGCELHELINRLYYLHQTQLPWDDFVQGNISFEYVNEWLIDLFPHINIVTNQSSANPVESLSSYFR